MTFRCSCAIIRLRKVVVAIVGHARPTATRRASVSIATAIDTGTWTSSARDHRRETIGTRCASHAIAGVSAAQRYQSASARAMIRHESTRVPAYAW
jgi:hypothetical protein